MKLSHRSKRYLNRLLIVAVLGHFGLGPGEASAFVLCFGADGHVAVEQAGHDHRVDAAQARERGSSEPGAYISGNGETPCADIPVVSDDHGAHKSLCGPHQPSLDLPLAAFVFTFIPIDERVATSVSLPGPPIADPGLPARRSVVLLI
ncbi:MAG: hypothetical protein ACREWE_04045 [Gammaproteobacteria bacterium]